MNEYGISWLWFTVFIPFWTILVLMADRIQMWRELGHSGDSSRG